MPKAKKLSCSICGKKFSMPAHLARHKSATHGAKKKSIKKRRKRAAARRGGRPPAIATKFKNLSLDELVTLIQAAKHEASTRLQEYRALLAE